MEQLVIGVIVGLIMGLTGAGGALISIPLFMQMMDFTVKEATVLSLLAVILGSIFNLFGKHKKIDYKTVASLVIFGGIANYFSLPLKNSISDWGIALLLLGIGIYSLWSVWQNKADDLPQAQVNIFLSAVIGLGLGLVTTLTGLGGGVLLVPLLIKVYKKTYAEALPSSLMTILFISVISLFMQRQIAMELITLKEIGLLSMGTLVAFGILTLLLKKLKTHHMALARKIVFSLVAIYAVTTVLIQSF